MKLHLPSGLRAALFACFAAFAGIGTTLSTATITGGVFAVTALSAVSVAEATEYTAVHTGSNQEIKCSTDGTTTNAVSLSSPTLTSEDTVTINLDGGWLSPGDGATIEANLVIEKLVLNNGYSGSQAQPKVFTFNGSVSGSGDFERTNANQPYQRFVFAGNVEGYTGTIRIHRTSHTVAFVNATNDTRAVNAAAMHVNGTLEFNGNYNVSSNLNDINTLKVLGGTVTLNGTQANTTASATVATGATLAVGASGALTLNGTTTLNGTLGNAGGALALNGTTTLGAGASLDGAVSINGAVVLGGAIGGTASALTFADGATVDVSALTVTTTNNGGTLSLFAEGNNGTVSGLTKDKLVGLDALEYGDVYTWTVNNNGTITYTSVVPTLSYTGGQLAWAPGVDMVGGQFQNDNLVFFSGDTEAVIGAPISATMVVVQDGATLSLSNGGTADNVLNSSSIHVDGSLILKDAALHKDARVLAESTGTVVIAGAQDTTKLTFTSQLEDYNGAVVVESGRFSIEAGRTTPFSSLTVQDGGQVEFLSAPSGEAEHTYSGDITISGHGYEGDFCDSALRAQRATLSGKLTVADAGASIAIWGIPGDYEELKLTGELAGSGTLTKKEGGHLSIHGNGTHNGTLRIEEGTVYIGSWQYSTNKVAFSLVDIEDGGKLSFKHASTRFDGMTVNLQEGSTLEINDSNCGNDDYGVEDPYNKGIVIGNVTVAGDATLRYEWKGVMNIANLTGNGDLSIVAPTQARDPRATIISKITNYAGEISGDPDKHDLYLGSVHQDTGYSALITDVTELAGDVITLTDFAKTGAGSFTLVGDVAVRGSLTMNYEGNLYCDEDSTKAGLSITDVADGTELIYLTTGSKLDINYSTISSLTSLAVNVFSLKDAMPSEGVDLGIIGATAADSDALKGILDVTGLASNEWDLQIGADGRVILKVNSDASYESNWDINWGGEGLANAPKTLTPVSALGDVTTFAGADADTQSVLAVNGGGGANAILVGGKENTRTSMDTWLAVQGGTWKIVAGGNQASNWGSGTRADFNGDSHILMSGGDVQYIIGANYMDGDANTGDPVQFIGDTYISVTSGTLKGSIIGGGISVHQDALTIVGDSNIYVYTPLSTNEDSVALWNTNPGSVIGGSVHVNHNILGRTLTRTGNTSITIDLSKYSGTAQFVKALIGGDFMAIGNGILNSLIDGSTNIAVDAVVASGEGVTFTGRSIVGGTDMGATSSNGTSTITGDTNITLKGGTYGNGTAEFYVIGGIASRSNNRSGYTAKVGGTASITVDGGATLSTNARIVGAAFIAEGIKNSTFSQGGSKVELKSGSIADWVTGGYFIGGSDGNSFGSATIGDILVSVNGATVAENINIYGGSVNWRGSADSTVEQGAITVDLLGGTVGNVYAAGSQNGSATMTTASTTVNVGSGITFRENSTVSGAYLGTTNATVTGLRTLAFSSSSYSNLGNVTFADFNAIDVRESTANISLSQALTALTGGAENEMTKLGAGTLSLSTADTEGKVKVAEGTLALNGQSLTATTVLDGATLDGTTAGSNAGALTLGANAGDVVTLNTGSGIALSSLALTSGTKIEVLGADALTGDYTLTLFSGLSADAISGITFGGDEGNVADLATYISNASAFTDGELILTEDGRLIISNQGDGSAWEWSSSAGGAWTDDAIADWGRPDGETETPATQKVVFGNDGVAETETTTITIGADGVNPTQVTVNATKGEYVFAGGAIEGTAELKKSGEGTLTLENANTSTGAMTISGGTVNLGSATTAGSWAGDINVSMGTLHIVNAGATISNKITISDVVMTGGGATLVVDGLSNGVSLTGISGSNGKLVANTATGQVSIGTAGSSVSFTSVTNGTGTLVFNAGVTIGTLTNAGTIKASGQAVTISGGTANGGILNTREGAYTPGTVTIGGNSTFTALQCGWLNIGTHTLTLNSDSSFHNLEGEVRGALVVSGGTTEVRDGGTLNLQSLALSAESRLTAGSVSVAGDVTSTTAKDTLDPSLVAGLHATGSIDIDGAATVDGSVVAKKALDIVGAVDVGGDLQSTEESVTLGSAAMVDGALTAGTSVSIDGAATVGGDLTAETGVSINGAATVGGNLTAKNGLSIVGTATVGEYAQDGTVQTVSDMYAYWGVSVGGTTKVTGNLTAERAVVDIGGELTVGGNVTAGTEVTIDGAATIKGNLSSGTNAGAPASDSRDVTIGGLADIDGSLTAGGNVTLGKGGNIGYLADGSVNTAAGAGNLTVGGSGMLSLGGTLQVAGTISGVTQLVVADGILTPLPTSTLLVDAKELVVGDALNLSFTSRQSVLNLFAANGARGEYTLISTDTVLTGTNTEAEREAFMAKLGLVAPAEAGLIALADGYSFVHDAVRYTLGLDTDGKSIVLSAVYAGSDWDGDTAWDSATDWASGALPDATSDVVFNGKGTSNTISLDAAPAAGTDTISISSLLVDTAATTGADHTQDGYTFTSTNAVTIDTQVFTVKSGSLTLDENVSVGSAADAVASSHVDAAGSLTINDGASLYTQTLVVDAAGTLVNDGTLVVSGALNGAADDAAPSITNTGSLSIGVGSKLDAIAGTTTDAGTLTVTGDASVEDLNYVSSVTVTNNSKLSVGFMVLADTEAVALEVGADSTLAMGEGLASPVGAKDLLVSTLKGSGTFSANRHVVLQKASTSGAKLDVSSLDLSDASGSIFSSLNVEQVLTLDVQGLAANTPLLTLTDSTVGSAITLNLAGLDSAADITGLTWDNTDGLGTTGSAVVTLTDGTTYTREWTDYTLVSANSLYTWDIVNDAADLQQLFAENNKAYATIDTSTGDVVLRVYKDEPREWLGGNWAGNETNNNGEVLDLTLIENAYDSLDTVDVINITKSTTINLTKGTDPDNPKNLLSTAADPNVGLLLKDVAGELTGANDYLMIRGDGASYDAAAGETIDDMDRVTFSNSKDTVFNGALTLNSVEALVESTTPGAGLTVGKVTLVGDAALVVKDSGKLTTGNVDFYGADASVENMGTMATQALNLSTANASVVNSGTLSTKDVTVSGANASVENQAGGILLVEDVTLSGSAASVENSGTMVADAVKLSGSTAKLVNNAGANLSTTEGMTLSGSNASVENSGTLTTEDVTLSGDNASLVNTGTLNAGAVTLSGAGASFSSTGAATVDSLNGTAGTIGGTISVAGTTGNYSGSYNAATVSLVGGAKQTLAAGPGLSLATEGTAADNKATAVLNYQAANATMDTINVQDADVVLGNMAKDASGKPTGPMNTLTVADGSSMVGGTLSFDVLASDIIKGVVTPGKAPVIIDGAMVIDGTTIKVEQADKNLTRATFDVSKGTDGLTLFTLADGGEIYNISEKDIKLEGAIFERYFENIEVKDGKVLADLITDYYTRDLAVTENGRTGLEMLDIADLELAPEANTDKYADLAAIMGSLKEYKEAGNATDADKLASAVAGSGLASLGMALSGDVERQLKAIRNRTTTMGVDASVVNEAMPYFNAWINAEGDHRSLDQDSTLAGYTLTSWGGTVGFDMDVNPTFSWGLALTAMYGDFSAESADMVEGDVDTYYVSAFARKTSGAWVHTFVATAGLSKSDISRTVSHANGSYTTNGDADGLSFGLLYEVGRTFALNEDASACWQPIFNVAYRHIALDGYSETGSDAGLTVGDQTLDTLTFGLGGRLQAVVGESIYNRTSVFEARALVKFDAGDRESEMETALLSAKNARGSVKSAEVDAFGIELGAGISIPMGMDAGSIFMDGSVEFRGSYTSANATLGYRVNF